MRLAVSEKTLHKAVRTLQRRIILLKRASTASIIMATASLVVDVSGLSSTSTVPLVISLASGIVGAGTTGALYMGLATREGLMRARAHRRMSSQE